MINKDLEKKLKEGGFPDIISWLEKCERGKIKVIEIRVDKTAGITGKKTLDKAIVDYLKEINIKVIYNEYVSRKKKKEKAQCDHFSHKIYNKKLSHQDNVDNFLNNKIAMFKMDKSSNESYYICPKCNVITLIP